jgi:hypothetical protein
MPSTPVLHNCMVHRCGKRRGGEVPISLLFPQSHFLNTTSSIQNLQKKKNVETQDPKPPRNSKKATTPHSDDSATQKGTIITERK